MEGEEGLKTLLFDKNNITQLDNLVSLPKLEVLDCSHNRIININEIKTLIGLRTVWLGFNLIENIDSLKYLTRIRELDLQRNRIFSISNGTLSWLYNLQRLNISFNYLSEFPNDLTSLEALRELNMSNNKIVEVKSGKWIKMWGLEVLNLASNSLETLESISGIADLKNLRNINLLSNPVFVMKQNEEKEKIKNVIIEYCPILRILNWEELMQSSQTNLQPIGKIFLYLTYSFWFSKVRAIKDIIFCSTRTKNRNKFEGKAKEAKWISNINNRRRVE